MKRLVLGVDDGFVHGVPASGSDTLVVGGVLVAIDADLSSLYLFVSIDTHFNILFVVYCPDCQRVIAIRPIANARQRYELFPTWQIFFHFAPRKHTKFCFWALDLPQSHDSLPVPAATGYGRALAPPQPAVRPTQGSHLFDRSSFVLQPFFVLNRRTNEERLKNGRRTVRLGSARTGPAGAPSASMLTSCSVSDRATAPPLPAAGRQSRSPTSSGCLPRASARSRPSAAARR